LELANVRDITSEEGISHVRFIRALIGEERISNEFQKIGNREDQIEQLFLKAKTKFPRLDCDKEFHPLFYLLWKCEKYLEGLSGGGLFRPTDEFTKLSSLGEDLVILHNSNIEGLEDKIKDLMSPNELFEKTTYEIHIAAKHKKRGHSVRFIPRDSEKGKRSADLLIDNLIEIECKKKDHGSKQDKRNIEYWNQMGKKMYEIMDYVGHNYSVIIKSEKFPMVSDVRFVTNNVRSLLKELKEGTFHFSDSGIDIVLRKLLPLNKVVASNAIEHRTSESFDYLIFPTEVMKTDNEGTLFKNYRFIAFKAEEIPARITSIIYSIKRAIGQLSGMDPGVIYVDITGVVQSMTDRDFERLYHLIKDILRNNSIISMITLTAEFTGNIQNGFYRYDRLWPYENESAKHELPDSYIIGRK
jgi:hypothetical protein